MIKEFVKQGEGEEAGVGTGRTVVEKEINQMNLIGTNAFFEAITSQNLTIVRLFLENGASLNQTTAFGMRPKDYAAIFLTEVWGGRRKGGKKGEEAGKKGKGG